MASKQAQQLEMFGETADSSQGADGGAEVDPSTSAPRAVPKSPNRTRAAVPAMTMEEVANEENLRRAFQQVASNHGAPGPDRQSVEEVREHLDDALSALRSELLDGSYRPGNIRRVWIPKSSGGQRGLLIHRMLKVKAVLPDGVVVSTEDGVPQGGPLSPLLSNIELDELDRELEQRGHRFVRYADDCNIYVRSERSGQRVMAGIAPSSSAACGSR